MLCKNICTTPALSRSNLVKIRNYHERSNVCKPTAVTDHYKTSTVGNC